MSLLLISLLSASSLVCADCVECAECAVCAVCAACAVCCVVCVFCDEKEERLEDDIKQIAITTTQIATIHKQVMKNNETNKMKNKRRYENKGSFQIARTK